MKVIRIVTSGQDQMKQCIDYCFRVLLYENFRTVKYILEKLLMSFSTKRIEGTNRGS